MMSDNDEFDEDQMFDDEKIYKEERKIANILLYGTSAAKQEIIIKLIYIGNTSALNSVLLAMSDAEYRRVMPTC